MDTNTSSSSNTNAPAPPGALSAPSTSRAGVVPPDTYKPNERLVMVNGRYFARIFRGEKLDKVLSIFGQNTRAGLDNLLRLNARILLREGGRVKPRSNQFLLVPTVWVTPEQRQARRLRLANVRAQILTRPRFRRPALRGLSGVLNAAWYEDYDSCPEGTVAVYDDEGDIIDCQDASGAGGAPTWGEPGGGLVQNDPPLWAGYLDENGTFVTCGEGFGYDPTTRACLPLVGTGNTPSVDPDAGKGCGGQELPGLYYGYFTADGSCKDASSDGSLLWDEKNQKIVPNPNMKGGGSNTNTGGGNTNTGGGSNTNTGGGGKTNTGGGSNTTTGGGNTTTPTTSGGTWQKVLEFVQKPIVIGAAVTGAVVTAAVVVQKKKKRAS